MTSFAIESGNSIQYNNYRSTALCGYGGLVRKPSDRKAFSKWAVSILLQLKREHLLLPCLFLPSLTHQGIPLPFSQAKYTLSRSVLFLIHQSQNPYKT